MISKKIIFILSFMITTLAHCAAGDKKTAIITTSLKPNMHDFIGFASGKAGSCMLHTPKLVEPGKDFTITIIYTEMRELKNEETLSKVIETLTKATQSPIFTRHHFKDALQKIMDEYAVKIEGTSDHTTLNANILCIKLTLDGVHSFGTSSIRAEGSKLEYILSAKIYGYELCGKEMTHAQWKNEIGHFEYDEPLTYSIQEHADTLLQNSLYAKFALVLNIPQFIQLRDAAANNTKDR